MGEKQTAEMTEYDFTGLKFEKSGPWLRRVLASVPALLFCSQLIGYYGDALSSAAMLLMSHHLGLLAYMMLLLALHLFLRHRLYLRSIAEPEPEPEPVAAEDGKPPREPDLVDDILRLFARTLTRNARALAELYTAWIERILFVMLGVVYGMRTLAAAQAAGQSAPGGNDWIVAAAGALLLSFCCLLLSAYLHDADPGELPESEALENLLRSGQWLFLALAGVLAVCGMGYEPRLDQWLALGLGAWTMTLAAELGLRGAVGLFAPEKPLAQATCSINLLTVAMVSSRTNPLSSFMDTVEHNFGVDMRSSWALGFAGRALFPCLTALAVLFWLHTAVVVVHPHERGVHLRFGRLVSEQQVEPGLRFKLPWPADQIRRFDARSVRAMEIGYKGRIADSDYLWDRPHSIDEHIWVMKRAQDPGETGTGDARDTHLMKLELMVVNAMLFYRIRDAVQYSLAVQNPDKAIEDIAYRELLGWMSGQNIEAIFDRDISEFSVGLETAIQRELDRLGLGVEILSFSIKGLHPPVEIAPEFQNVVSAQIEKTALIFRGESYRELLIPSTVAEARTIVRRAEADRLSLLAAAYGDAVGFQSVEFEYSASPEMFRLHKWLDAVEGALAYKRLYLADPRFMGSGSRLWLDFTTR